MPRFDNPTIVLLSIDTLRSDRLPVYGYRGVRTPAIDSIRAESILYERAYAPSPMTLPSHLSMLTGLLPASHRVRNNVGYTFAAREHFFLPCHLKARGYSTGAAVSTYVLRSESGIAECFDLYEDSIDPREGQGRFVAQQRPGRVTLEKAIEWLNDRKSEPFFLFFHIYEPHVPYDPPEPFKSRYEDPYDGEVALSDEIVGSLAEELKRRQLWSSSIVILTSDHGEGLGDHGEQQHSVLLNRELIQVPLLIKLPDGALGGTTVTEAVQLTDITPTLLALIGERPPDVAEGQPIVGVELPTDRSIFAETLYPRIHMGWSDLASLVRDRYHFIEGPKPELYDLVADPAETTNLVSTDRRAAAAMREALAPFRAPMKPVGIVDPETARRMAALGYIGSASIREGTLPDPKDHIHELETIRDALALAESGQLDEAETKLRELLNANPSMSEAWMKLGAVLTRAGDDPGAWDAYRESVRVSPVPSPDLLLEAGFAALRAGQLEDAESLAQAATSSLPKHGWSLIARVEMAKGRMQHAEDAARQALHDPPRVPDLLLLAETIQQQERYEDTLTLLAQAEALATAAGGPGAFGLEALRADTFARQGKIQKAKQAYEMEIESFPYNLRAWGRLCVIHHLEGNRVEVNRLLDQMVALNPGPEARRFAASTLAALDDPDGTAR